ncbi:MAG: thiolase family protein [Chloroflexi bacterium]|nr:thiolase family protein [Chloroflexota bacterium]
MAQQASNRQFAIAGLGVINGRGLGKSGRTLQAEATRLAIEDAGLRREQVDGAINGMGAGGSMPGAGGWADAFPRVLGLPIKFYWTVARGGTGASIGLLAATRALELGIADYVVVACGEAGWSNAHNLLRTGSVRGGRPGWLGTSMLGADMLGFSSGAGAASFHGFFASRHMYEYGTTQDQFGSVAVSIRQWACLNPHAQMYGRPITIDDYRTSRWVVEPYKLLDFCLQSDAAAAVVVTTAERARDLKQPPVYIMGQGFGDHAREYWWDKTNYTRLDVAPARAAAFRQADIELGDIEAGNIAPGGTIPVNTGGGLLSGFYLFDWTGLAEGVRQLRGECGDRQVADADIALVTGHGGELLIPGMCSTHATCILGR